MGERSGRGLSRSLRLGSLVNRLWTGIPSQSTPKLQQRNTTANNRNTRGERLFIMELAQCITKFGAWPIQASIGRNCDCNQRNSNLYSRIRHCSMMKAGFTRDKVVRKSYPSRSELFYSVARTRRLISEIDICGAHYELIRFQP